MTNHDRVPTPIIYPGGKTLLLPHLMPLVKPHSVLIEPFMGALTFCLYDVHERAFVSDKNSAAVNFFRVCQDRRKWKKLYWALYSTPYSREEFFFCDQTWQSVTDDVERARRWFVVANLSFTHETDNHSFRVSRESDVAGALRNHVNDLKRVHDKLIEHTVIENLGFRQFLKLYPGGRDTLIFADPPYLNDNPEGLSYADVLSWRDHYDLIGMLDDSDGQVILCGYKSQLYDNLLGGSKDWRLKTVTRQAHVGNADYTERDVRVEYIWIKDAKPEHSMYTLF